MHRADTWHGALLFASRGWHITATTYRSAAEARTQPRAASYTRPVQDDHKQSEGATWTLLLATMRHGCPLVADTFILLRRQTACTEERVPGISAQVGVMPFQPYGTFLNNVAEFCA